MRGEMVNEVQESRGAELGFVIWLSEMRREEPKQSRSSVQYLIYKG